MSKRKRRSDNVLGTLQNYALSRTLELIKFSDIHTRLTDDYTVIDVWPTTGRYYVGKTSYHELSDKRITERAGEKDILPVGEKLITEYLDKIFFAADK